jgi:hypothetical protein
MSVTTYEATVENGQIKLPPTLRLPEKTKVYVVVPDVEIQPVIKIGSPRLTHPEQFVHFVKEVVEEPEDASLR